PRPADPEIVFWPNQVARDLTVKAFQEAFATIGYDLCPNEDYEPGFEKIALFATPDGAPKHAARQLANGKWTSKLGWMEDIKHPLHAIAGLEYGSVVQIMKRGKPWERTFEERLPPCQSIPLKSPVAASSISPPYKTSWSTSMISQKSGCELWATGRPAKSISIWPRR